MNMEKQDYVLRGERNYIRWLQRFRAEARAIDTVSLFLGEEPIMTEPDEASFGLLDEWNTSGIFGISVLKDGVTYLVASAKYERELQKFQTQNKRVLKAIGLITKMVDLPILSEIVDYGPQEAYAYLESRYRLDAQTGARQTSARFQAIELQQFGSIEEYIDEIRYLDQDLREYTNHGFTEAQLVNKLLDGLTPAYRKWATTFKARMFSEEGMPSFTQVQFEVLGWALELKNPMPTRDPLETHVRTSAREFVPPSGPAESGVFVPRCTVPGCGKVGHKTEDCHSFKKRAAKAFPGEKSSRTVRCGFPSCLRYGHRTEDCWHFKTMLKKQAEKAAPTGAPAEQKAEPTPPPPAAADTEGVSLKGVDDATPAEDASVSGDARGAGEGEGGGRGETDLVGLWDAAPSKVGGEASEP